MFFSFATLILSIFSGKKSSNIILVEEQGLSTTYDMLGYILQAHIDWQKKLSDHLKTVK